MRGRPACSAARRGLFLVCAAAA